MAADTDSPISRPPVIRAVILDYGEVLCHLPAIDTIERLAFLIPDGSAYFHCRFICNHARRTTAETCSHSEYWQNFATQAGVIIGEDDIEQARQLDLELWSQINDAMVLWVQQLRAAGFKTSILSNMPADMAAHMRKTFSWLGHFDHHIFSGEVRSVKPEPRSISTA